jgi:hypothetical protein
MVHVLRRCLEVSPGRVGRWRADEEWQKKAVQDQRCVLNGLDHLKFLQAAIAFSTLLLTMGLVAGGLWSQGPAALTYLYEHWVGFITASLLMAIVQGLGCYAASYRGDKLLALGGNTGNFIYDVGTSSNVNSKAQSSCH